MKLQRSSIFHISLSVSDLELTYQNYVTNVFDKELKILNGNDESLKIM